MTEEIKTKTTQKTAKQVKIDSNTPIKVKSGFYGVLHFKNTRSGELFIWRHIGDIQFLSMDDLRTMKARNVGYFKNQWIVIMGVAEDFECNATPADIYKALGVDMYYKDFIDPTTFNAACNWSEEEILEMVPLLSNGSKQNLIVALNDFIKDGTLDSRRKVKAFEKALGCELLING